MVRRKPRLEGEDYVPNTDPKYDYQPPFGRHQVKQFEGSNKWAASLNCSFCSEPIVCVGATLCPCVCVFMQRKQLLLNDLTHYQCCAGLWGIGYTGFFDGWTQGNETLCLSLESTLCLGCALRGNRFMVQQHYNLTPDVWDSFCYFTSCPCILLAWALQDENLENIGDVLLCLCAGCIVAQQFHQIDVFGYPQGTRFSMQ